ncbi:MAG: hypothetical protein ACYDA6_08695 [Solirubrobacteraceae bacterium]
MLVSEHETVVVSSMGWVDRGGVVVWDPASERTRTALLDSQASHLELLPGEGDLFAVVHHHKGSYFVTARHLSDPSQVIARLDVDGLTAQLDGDRDVWSRLPQFFGGWYAGNA